MSEATNEENTNEEFIRAWIETRTKVLNRSAARALEESQRLRNLATHYPNDEKDLTAKANGWLRYSIACTKAAEDPLLPIPDGTSKEFL